MKATMRWACLAAAVCVGAAAWVRADIELSGVFIAGDRAQFSLSDTDTGAARWVATGQKFGGYEVGAYDAKAEVLTLAKGGERLQVQLKAAAIKAGYVSVGGTIELGQGERLQVTDATLVFGQENVFPLKDGIVLRLTPTVLPDGNLKYAAVFERKGADGKVEKLSSPRVIAGPGQSFSMNAGDLGFGFAPRATR